MADCDGGRAAAVADVGGVADAAQPHAQAPATTTTTTATTTAAAGVD